MPTHIYMLVEDQLDEVVASRIILEANNIPSTCFGKKGWSWIRTNLSNFNSMASSVPILCMVDLMDTGHDCPVTLANDWLPNPESDMVFRVVVRELESWLLADRKGLASFLGIANDKIPANPEELFDPKQTLVNLARRSRFSSIRKALVPNVNSTAQVGPGYTEKLTDFIFNRWDITSARRSSPSLDRCLNNLTLFD